MLTTSVRPADAQKGGNMLRKLLLVEDEEHLRNHEGSGHIVDFVRKEDDAVIEKAGIDIVGTFAAVGLLYDHRN